MNELSLDEVVSQYLDNTDLKIQVSENLNWVELTFIVFGKVEGNYWKVTFYCEGIMSLNILKDGDGGYDDCFLVLNTLVLNKNMCEFDENKKINCMGTDSFWYIHIYGSSSMKINCINFRWDIKRLTEEEYKKTMNK
jgi:hypothetical protein